MSLDGGCDAELRVKSYSRVQACAKNQPSDKISFKKIRWLDRVASIFDLSKYKIHLL